MGKGQRYVFCCESKTWCCVIHWFQWIAGVLFISAASTLFFDSEKKLKKYEKDYITNPLDEDEEKKPEPSEYKITYLAIVMTDLISGLALFGLGTLLYCGVQNRSNKMLKAYIGCYIAYQVIDTVAVLLLFIYTQGRDFMFHSGGIFRLLIIWFVVWVVNFHRREVCYNNPGFGAVPNNFNDAVPQTNSKPGVITQSLSAIGSTALQTTSAIVPAPVSSDDPAS